jgi:single-strand DNA-binding protein
MGKKEGFAMLNQVILVGRLTHDPELRKSEEGRSVATIRIAVQRGFKSGETNEYETDFFNCTLWSGVAEATVDYCRKGSVIGIKARLAQKEYAMENKKTFSYPEIIVEKISFISPARD